MKTSKSCIDWNEVHRKLDASRAALELHQRSDPESRKTILKTRAKELARKKQPVETAEESIELTEFMMAHEKYAIESSFVREVSPLRELTPVPCTPPFVLGIINVRGQILSVIDIRKFFELPEKGVTDLNKVIIIRDEKMEFGILADQIIGVRSVPVRVIQSSIPTFTGIRAEYLKGVAEGPVIILDTEKLLSDRRIVIDEEVET
ncbi:MAG TPA: chemotaxis protein CheW [Acidobacteriota bacterium]